MWASFLEWCAEVFSEGSLWALLLEGCADLFAATNRSAKHRLLVTATALLLFTYLTLTLAARFGVGLGLVAPGVLALLALLGARGVFVARSAVWQAASLSLEDAQQRPPIVREGSVMAPTERALTHLALAVDAARRGRFSDAHEELTRTPRAFLRPDEMHLLDGVRATVSLGLGEDHRAAQQAINALPTGSDDLDRMLGRALLRDAWHSAARVSAIDAAWAASGVSLEGGALPRLRRIIHLRIETEALDAIPAEEARALAEEAEAVGDAALAADLSAHGRSFRAYR